MIKRRNVKCGAETDIKKLEIGVDTVYRRYNIHDYEDSEGNKGYEYDEDEMTIAEYLRDEYPEGKQLTEDAIGEITIFLGELQDQFDNAIAELTTYIAEVTNDV